MGEHGRPYRSTPSEPANRLPFRTGQQQINYTSSTTGLSAALINVACQNCFFITRLRNFIWDFLPPSGHLLLDKHNLLCLLWVWPHKCKTVIKIVPHLNFCTAVMLHLFLWAWLHSVTQAVVVSFGQINANLCYYYYFLKKNKNALRFVSRLSLMLTACVQARGRCWP